MIYNWMAQGFIESSNQNEELEDIGESYFDELVRRSFIEISEEGEGLFKMHDLVHDLAQFVASSECLTIKSTTKSIPERVRHVNFDSSLHKGFPRPLLEVKKLRTIHMGSGFGSIIPSEILNFRFLRVLVFFGLNFKVPSSIGDLKHLSLFCLARNRGAKTLPESFGRLEVLECLELVSFPSCVRHLTALKELKVAYCINLVTLSESFASLTSLRMVEIINCPKLFLPEGIDRVPIVKINGRELHRHGLIRSTVESSSDDWRTIGVTIQDHQNEQDV
ncbi:hypothetical protein F0562_015488 [Nyssa sinensis]|uniref:NB-ARC domain-containing protein n=1 Tax=Nyssa sinensis TaxID=561372 RepID=A0A5J4ZJN1_9ASTE|nr:hypothetical protein F0562_015488 [Nyssa sinensis]